MFQYADTIDDRHTLVEQNNTGLQFLSQFNAFVAIADCGEYFDIASLLQADPSFPKQHVPTDQ